MKHSEPKPGVVVRALTGLVACRDLPEPLPEEPMTLLIAWYAAARDSGVYDDFSAMTVATATPDGTPAARVVLCKAIEHDPPALVFYTSYESRKGRELTANPRAAAVFHWPHAQRQARIEGPVMRTSDQESDAYFRTRPLLSRIGARVSPQSAAIGSRETVIAEALKIARAAATGEPIERPAWWGGYRILCRRVELWSAREGRLHDRAVWSRPDEASSWSVSRLGA